MLLSSYFQGEAFGDCLYLLTVTVRIRLFIASSCINTPILNSSRALKDEDSVSHAGLIMLN